MKAEIFSSFEDVTRAHQAGLYSNIEDFEDLTEYDCNFNLIIDSETHNVYACLITKSELSLYSDKGVLSFFIDVYYGRPSYVLHDIIE